LATFQHPSALNPLQRYSQACAVLRSTSRARNDAWYRQALDLDFQLHLRADGTGVLCRAWTRKTGQWSTGPAVDEDTLKNPEKFPAFAAEVVAFAQKSGATAVGVVLHVADEFATTELKPSFDNPGALADLRVAAEVDPASILDDSSIPPDQNSWRILPYPAAGSEAIATTITLTRLYGPFLDQLRLAGEAANFPVVTHALSAPLVALLTIPRAVRPSEGRTFLTVLHYANFTVLAFFNEHGDLRLIRTLQHRGQRRPSNLRHAASTTTAALEFVDPEVYLLHLSPHADPGLIADLRVVFPSSRVEEIDWIQSPFNVAEIPPHAPELQVSVSPPTDEAQGAISHTFATFQSERWAFQNFLPTPRDTAEIYPARSEMRLLRAIRMIRLGIAVAAVLALAWALFGVFTILRSPEWAFDTKADQAVKQRLAGLNAEKQRVEHWDNLLADRSKAWTTMELVCRLFPERSGVLIRTCQHLVRADPAPGKQQAGFIKEWKISGYARDEAIPRLNLINSSQGIAAIFSELSRVTQNPAFRTDLISRSLIPNVRTQENGGFRMRAAEEIQDDDPTTYPWTFELSITQRFESGDPMSINVAKAP